MIRMVSAANVTDGLALADHTYTLILKKQMSMGKQGET
jgi:hypothetical protein